MSSIPTCFVCRPSIEATGRGAGALLPVTTTEDRLRYSSGQMRSWRTVALVGVMELWIEPRWSGPECAAVDAYGKAGADVDR